MSSYYLKFRDRRNEFRFTLKAGNGEPILNSEGYQTSQGCDGGISSVRLNSPIDARYDRLPSRDGQYYFNLKAANGEIIGNSETYRSEAAREVGIASVKRNGPVAPVRDTTKSVTV